MWKLLEPLPVLAVVGAVLAAVSVYEFARGATAPAVAAAVGTILVASFLLVVD